MNPLPPSFHISGDLERLGADPRIYERSGALSGPPLFDGVRSLPGVTRIFRPSSRVARWFDAPVTQCVAIERWVQVWITVGVSRDVPYAETVCSIGTFFRTHLTDCGFAEIDVWVRVAVFE